MAHLIKRFAQISFLGAFSLNFCCGVALVKSAEGDANKLISKESGVPNKAPLVLSKEDSILPKVDYGKLLMEAAKKLGSKPLALLTIEGSNLQKLLQKATQIADKVVPDCSSLISFAVTGFAGGLSCPGVDEKAPCYLVIFLNNGNIAPIILFKAQTDCVLIKSLLENKTATDTLKSIPAGIGKTYCWQIYGDAALIKALDKDLEQTFPFIYKEKTPEEVASQSAGPGLLKFELDFNLLSDIFQKIDSKDLAFLKFLWDTFVVSDIKKMAIGFDIVDKTLEVKTSICPQEFSPLAAFINSMQLKIKDAKFLDWSSCESVQELVFYSYVALINYMESLDYRIKYAPNSEAFWIEFKNVWSTLYPLMKSILIFCDENYLGNTQSYADLQASKDLISTKGFGFFEGKSSLKRETILKFLDEFSAQVKSSLKQMVDKKYFGWEFCQDVSLNVKKLVEKHRDCDIDQVFWKANGDNAYCSIWFAVYKNYLLYADDISNLKRLIERMEEKMKAPSYQPLNANCFSCMKMDFVSILRVLDIGNQELPNLSIENTSGLESGSWVNTLKIPGFLDVFSLKTLLPSVPESAKKEEANPSNQPVMGPAVK